MSELKRVLMNRDGLTAEEADAEIAQMYEMIAEGDNPEDVLYEWGLEPYVFDILLR